MQTKEEESDPRLDMQKIRLTRLFRAFRNKKYPVRTEKNNEQARCRMAQVSRKKISTSLARGLGQQKEAKFSNEPKWQNADFF